jgi:hypothetical protein
MLGEADAVRIAPLVGLDTSSVYRTWAEVPARGSLFTDPALEACVRAVGDARFAALDAGDLRQAPGWARYRRHG